MNPYRPLLAALVCTALPTVAHALSTYNDGNENIVEQTIPDVTSKPGETRVTLGLGVADSPRYVGSSHQRVRVIPYVNAIWANGWFAGFPRGVGYNFSTDPRMQYGLRVTLDMGRKVSTSTALKGLGDIGVRPEMGAFMNYALTRQLKLDTNVRYGAGNDSRGALLDLSLHYHIPLAENQFVTVGVGTIYANSSYMQSYYGVNPAQSASSGYKVYTPGAGMREIDLTASYTYKLNRQWAIITGATLGQLGGTVTAAPMSRSSTHNSVYLQTNYTF